MTTKTTVVLCALSMAVGLAGLGSSGCALFGIPCTDCDSVPSTVPDFAAAKFNDPTTIDNTFFPLAAGATWEYQSETADGVERTLIEVLSDTRTVSGVVCRVVRDRVFLSDVLVEDTIDFFAQDDDGNVWYMGEEVDNYNYDSAGLLQSIDHAGSWEAGKDVAGAGVTALPGIQMKASPAVGDEYHQEFYKGEAEDMGKVVALNVSVTLAGGAMHSCLKTLDSNPLDPGTEEFKYYAPGIGLVREEPVGGGDVTELVSSTP